jgi:hypothetical protein
MTTAAIARAQTKLRYRYSRLTRIPGLPEARLLLLDGVPHVVTQRQLADIRYDLAAEHVEGDDDDSCA